MDPEQKNPRANEVGDGTSCDTDEQDLSFLLRKLNQHPTYALTEKFTKALSKALLGNVEIKPWEDFKLMYGETSKAMTELFNIKENLKNQTNTYLAVANEAVDDLNENFPKLNEPYMIDHETTYGYVHESVMKSALTIIRHLFREDTINFCSTNLSGDYRAYDKVSKPLSASSLTTWSQSLNKNQEFLKKNKTLWLNPDKVGFIKSTGTQNRSEIFHKLPFFSVQWKFSGPINAKSQFQLIDRTNFGESGTSNMNDLPEKIAACNLKFAGYNSSDTSQIYDGSVDVDAGNSSFQFAHRLKVLLSTLNNDPEQDKSGMIQALSTPLIHAIFYAMLTTTGCSLLYNHNEVVAIKLRKVITEISLKKKESDPFKRHAKQGNQYRQMSRFGQYMSLKQLWLKRDKLSGEGASTYLKQEQKKEISVKQEADVNDNEIQSEVNNGRKIEIIPSFLHYFQTVSSNEDSEFWETPGESNDTDSQLPQGPGSIVSRYEKLVNGEVHEVFHIQKVQVFVSDVISCHQGRGNLIGILSLIRHAIEVHKNDDKEENMGMIREIFQEIASKIPSDHH